MAHTGYRGRQNAKSSGNVPRQKEAEAKAAVVLKAATLEEIQIMPTLIWNREDLPFVYRENSDKPLRPVQVVVMGGRHLVAIKAQLNAMDDRSVFYIYLQNANDIV